VATRATLLLENLLASARPIVERIRIGRRLERVDVKRQCVKLLVAAPDPFLRAEDRGFRAWLESPK
jgi:hypothetical protein